MINWCDAGSLQSRAAEKTEKKRERVWNFKSVTHTDNNPTTAKWQLWRRTSDNKIRCWYLFGSSLLIATGTVLCCVIATDIRWDSYAWHAWIDKKGANRKQTRHDIQPTQYNNVENPLGGLPTVHAAYTFGHLAAAADRQRSLRKLLWWRLPMADRLHFGWRVQNGSGPSVAWNAFTVFGVVATVVAVVCACVAIHLTTW